jgi:hypothetical protein
MSTRSARPTAPPQRLDGTHSGCSLLLSWYSSRDHATFSWQHWWGPLRSPGMWATLGLIVLCWAVLNLLVFLAVLVGTNAKPRRTSPSPASPPPDPPTAVYQPRLIESV